MKFNDKVVSCNLRCFVCDSPARSLVCGVKGHTGYNGCGKCVQEGDYVNNRVTFPEMSAQLRTDENFRLRLHEEHHKETTPLEDIKIDMIKAFPLDYMHLICLGVVKKLIHSWTAAKLKNAN